MSDYFSNLDPKIKEYFSVLSEDIPDWLVEYIETKELLSQSKISVTCGAIYSDLFENNFFYSSLDHSVAVALIIWHFTKDKIQALAGLFHDIATPAFKHCVDFLNEDYMNQESTEGLTTSIIENSPDLTKLLARDNINITEIDNYHLYPIAGNDTPRLSSDRLEYSLSNALLAYNLLALEEIRGIYNNIEIETNENGEMELGFKTKKTARKFVFVTSKMSVFYRDDCTRFSMQFIADILKKLSNDGKIQKSDLYKMGDQEVISLIEQSKYSAVFKKWRLAKKVKTSDQEPKGVYFVHHGAKVRYIDPLCQGKRMSELCKLAKAAIDKNLSYDMSKYVYLDFSSSATSSGN